jgi:hypothetical protein
MTFYGQELDCPDGYLTEWHTCPQCRRAFVECECENLEELIKELAELYRQKATEENQ